MCKCKARARRENTLINSITTSNPITLIPPSPAQGYRLQINFKLADEERAHNAVRSILPDCQQLSAFNGGSTRAINLVQDNKRNLII